MCLRSRQNVSPAPRIMQLRDVSQLGTDETMHQSSDPGPWASLSSVKGGRIEGLKTDHLGPYSRANLAAVPTPGE